MINSNLKCILAFFGVLLSLLLFSGCAANRGATVFVGTTNPIFIKETTSGKSVSLITGASEGNFTNILIHELNANGYKVEQNAKADIIIRSNLNYFRINSFKRYDPSAVIGPNLSPFAFSHFRKNFAGFGFYDDERYYERRFYYMAQMAVMISIGEKDYATNLNLETADSIAPIRRDSAVEIFNTAAARKIIEFLRGFNSNLK